jgi:hypothetical protein
MWLRTGSHPCIRLAVKNAISLRLFRLRGGRNHHQSTTPPFHILDTVCIREAHGKRRGLLESLVYCTLGWAGIRIREDRSSVLRTTILGLRVLTA